MKGTEKELIEQARSGHDAAWAELFRRHWPAVWRAAYALLGRHDAATDAAQEAFFRAISALDRFDPDRSFRPWITRIAVNRAIDQLRRERRGAQFPQAPEPGEAAFDVEFQDALLQAVARLAPDRRWVVVLHYWLDYGKDEISEILDVPVGTVGSRLSRALTELRTDLEAQHV